MEAKSLAKILEAVELQMLKSTIQKNLSVAEIVCLYVIDRSNNLTIAQFADFMQISQSNATYIVRKLINKGYLKKRQSTKDRREFVLDTTDKFTATVDYESSLIERLATDVLPEIEGLEHEELFRILSNMEL